MFVATLPLSERKAEKNASNDDKNSGKVRLLFLCDVVVCVQDASRLLVWNPSPFFFVRLNVSSVVYYDYDSLPAEIWLKPSSVPKAKI